MQNQALFPALLSLNLNLCKSVLGFNFHRCSIWMNLMMSMCYVGADGGVWRWCRQRKKCVGCPVGRRAGQEDGSLFFFFFFFLNSFIYQSHFLLPSHFSSIFFLIYSISFYFFPITGCRTKAVSSSFRSTHCFV